MGSNFFLLTTQDITTFAILLKTFLLIALVDVVLGTTP